MLRPRQKIPFNSPALQKFPSNPLTRSRICAEKPRMPLPGTYQSVRKAGFSSENLEWVKIPAGPPADFKPFHESPHILPLGTGKRVKKRPLCPCKTTDGLLCDSIFSGTMGSRPNPRLLPRPPAHKPEARAFPIWPRYRSDRTSAANRRGTEPH